MKEIWKKIEQSPYYEISNYGKLRRIGTKRFLKPIYRDGYASYQYIMANGRLKRTRAAVLTAKAFVDNPNKYKFVGYKDGDTSNLRSDNLYWKEKNTTNHEFRKTVPHTKRGYIITEDDGTTKGFYTLEEVKMNYFPEMNSKVTFEQLVIMLKARKCSIVKASSDDVSIYYKRGTEERQEIKNKIDDFVDYVTNKYGRFWFNLSYAQLRKDPIVVEHYKFIRTVR